ncbi:MAG: uroporphyrinogen decarboxylase family protein, partial [Armatimonadota bacterium]|nr:uroporphyrinogen decarboxylase family protein [Armatimonadota bacterium]
FTPAVLERFRRETGAANPAEYFGMETRHVGFAPLREKPDFSAYYADVVADGPLSIGEYGNGNVGGKFFHFTRRVYPLRNAATPEEIDAYPWPDVKPAYRHAHLEEEVNRLHAQGFFVDAMCGHIFELAWQLIGFERFFEQMILNPALVERVLDRITDDNCFRARRFAEAGVDMLRTGDDVGMQDRLMMKPEEWRRFLKPRLAREIAAAREVRPDIPVWYHSDGKITEIIDDLIEVGVTVLNPVQPECLDVRWLKERYGDRLAFWGTIGTQTVMPFGTPDQVRQTVREMIDLFWPGLVLAPTHVLEPDVPWENVVAFFQAVEDFGSPR